MTPSKVLILGGEGFVGSNLVSRFPGARVLDDRSFHKREFGSTIVRSINEPIDEIIRESDLVIHAACRDIRTSMRDPMEDARVNILGTLNVLMLCRKFQVPLFYISSVSVHHEVSHYAVSKSAGERYALMYRQWVPTCVVRLSNVFGPGDTESVVGKWLREDSITVIDADASRDFTYIQDTAEGIVKAVEAWPKEVVDIGTGKETTLSELATWLSKKTGKPVQRMPPREIDNVHHRVVDPTIAERVIGFRAKWDIFSGLDDYLSHYDHPRLLGHLSTK